MDIRHLDLLRELAGRGSVTEVAKATFRTPSAVSQQLKSAQREFGMALVEPHGRGLRLTAAGKLLAQGGADVAASLERVQAQWDSFVGRPSGTVRIASLPSAATFLLPKVLASVADTDLTIKVADYDVAEVEFAALCADNDIVVAHSLTGVRPAGTTGEVVVPICQEPLDVAMGAGHPLAGEPWVVPEQVAQYAWIGVPKGYPFDTVLASVRGVSGTDLDIRQRIRDNRLIESLVAADELLAILPRFTTVPGAGLLLKELRGVPSRRHISAVMRADRAERLAVRTVLEHLRRVGSEVAEAHRVSPAAPCNEART
ncbi:LysR family transcriptional regulator [Glutamicibacter endophyticus]